MTPFLWILFSGLAMAFIALVGSVLMLLSKPLADRMLLPLVAFAAGTLIGGALLHMLPAGIDQLGNTTQVYMWMLAGFVLFFLLEQGLHYHHCHAHDADGCDTHAGASLVGEGKSPATYLILIGDGIHNLIGGLAVAGAFLADIRLGLMAFLAAAAHEIPQELGDYGILVHGGWKPRWALLFNFLSGLLFLVGALVAYGASSHIDVGFLLPFAAGNFLYIGAADLIPEINRNESLMRSITHFLAFSAGLGLMLVIRMLGHG